MLQTGDRLHPYLLQELSALTTQPLFEQDTILRVHQTNQTHYGIKVAQFVLNMTESLANLAFNTIPIHGVRKDSLRHYKAEARPTQSVWLSQNFKVWPTLLETLCFKQPITKTRAQTKNG